MKKFAKNLPFFQGRLSPTAAAVRFPRMCSPPSPHICARGPLLPNREQRRHLIPDLLPFIKYMQEES